jgi:hypothetical protein
MRLKTLLIFGAGYLWGTRSGRDRYQEIVDGVRGFMDSDVVQDLVARVRQPGGGGTPEGDVDQDLPEDEGGEPVDEEEDQGPYADEDEDYEDEDYEEEEGEEDEPENPTEEGRSTGRRGMIRRRAPAGGGGGGSA